MNLANKLTLARIICVPFFIASFYIPVAGRYIAAVIFIAAFLTDIFDGRIARKQNAVTNFGKLIDPIADKLMMCAALVLLCSIKELHAIVVIIILTREFMVSGLRTLVSSGGGVLPASWLGKLKTIVQCIAVVALLIRPLTDFLLGRFAAAFFVWAAVMITIWSGLDYFVKNYKVINFN